MTSNSDAASAYRQAAFENAPPLKILRMLYQGAIRFLNQARELDPAADGAAFNERLSRADAIVVELRCGLQHEPVPEVSANLEQLYLFVESRVSAALRDRDVAPIAEAVDILETLLDAWKQVEVESERIAG